MEATQPLPGRCCLREDRIQFLELSQMRPALLRTTAALALILPALLTNAIAQEKKDQRGPGPAVHAAPPAPHMAAPAPHIAAPVQHFAAPSHAAAPVHVATPHVAPQQIARPNIAHPNVSHA